MSRLKVEHRVAAIARAVGHDLGRGVGQLLAVRRQQQELEVVLAC